MLKFLLLSGTAGQTSRFQSCLMTERFSGEVRGKALRLERFQRTQKVRVRLYAPVVSFPRKRKEMGARDKRTEGDRDERGEIGREGSVQLCASLGFLLSTSSSRGQTGIIRFGKLPERPLWRSHGTLVCLFNCG